MEIGPIFRSLVRNRIGAILIALQLAVTMAVVINAAHIIQDQLRMMNRPSGVDEANLFRVTMMGFVDDFNVHVTVDEDLALLRAMDGVVDAVQMNATPLSGGGWSTMIKTEPGEQAEEVLAAMYLADDHGLNTLGVQLLAGEDFVPADVSWRNPDAGENPDLLLLTRAMAAALFPGLDPLDTVGMTVYKSDDHPLRIKGIIDNLVSPWAGAQTPERSLIMPQKLDSQTIRYMVRTEAGRRDELMPVIEEALARSNRNRLLEEVVSFEEDRVDSYLFSKALTVILSTVTAVLVLITGLGILGMASFSVTRRRRQIGTRRALGGSKVAIVRYFLVENLLISGIGLGLGAVLTMGVNMVLASALETDPIGWQMLPIGIAGLLVISQLGTLGPALRAARLPPALATQTV